MKRRNLLLASLSASLLSACRSIGLLPKEDTVVSAQGGEDTTSAPEALRENSEMDEMANKTDAEWREILTPQEYNVLRGKGTEYAFSGEYWEHKEKGLYVCAGCGNPLFGSDTKYASGTGWPSFWAPISEEAIGTERDSGLGMRRTEVHCSRCGGHLGHVFGDGPKPTGLRYCLNSVSLDFEPADQS